MIWCHIRTPWNLSTFPVDSYASQLSSFCLRSRDSCRGNVATLYWNRLCFYQTRSAWSVDQGSNKNHSPAYNFAPTVTKFCVMWEGLSLPHGTKFGNCRCKIVDSRAFPSWSLIHGLRRSGLIKAEPGHRKKRKMLILSEFYWMKNIDKLLIE